MNSQTSRSTKSDNGSDTSFRLTSYQQALLEISQQQVTDSDKDIVIKLRVGTDDWNRVKYTAQAFGGISPTRAARLLLRQAVESLIRYRLKKND